MFRLKEEKPLMKVLHKKSGETYYVDDVVIDTTNDLLFDKQVKILYHNNKAERFVREANEFFDKFEIEHGFNILSKACELALRNVENFHNEVCCEPSVSLGKTPVSLGDSCHCVCKSENYIGEMIDVDVFVTYKQRKESAWRISTDMVKKYAYEQLANLFTVRCSNFELVKKEYDNATNDYFLVGYKNYDDYPFNPTQVCKIPKEVFHDLLNNLEIY